MQFLSQDFSCTLPEPDKALKTLYSTTILRIKGLGGNMFVVKNILNDIVEEFVKGRIFL